MNNCYILQNEKRSGILNIDARTKIILMVLGNIAVFFASSIELEIILITFYLIFGFLCGAYSISVKIVLGYFSLLLLEYLAGMYLNGAWKLMVITFSQFICMILPCVLLASIMIVTTKVNEFIAGLNKMYVSKKVIIPLAVMLRYFPVISEDWKNIKNSMKMRDVAFSLSGFFKKPAETIECIYVPLLMSASKVADELSAAAITRAIENPTRRTCMQKMKIGVCDYLCISIISIIVVLVILLKGGFLFG